MEHKMSSNAYLFYYVWLAFSRSQWPRGLRRGRTAARSLAGIARSSPLGGMDICQLSVRGLLRLADHSSRGVPSVVV